MATQTLIVVLSALSTFFSRHCLGKKTINMATATTPDHPILHPTIIPRPEHNISRVNISHNALFVLRRLHHAGFEAYLVGGGVRDLLLGIVPKDFDIATNALPEEIKNVFRNCLLIGRRFRLAHIRFGNEIIEVATFRASVNAAGNDDRTHSEHGMLMRDNVYGSIDEDAIRRDFTINALYYNIADFSVVDYVAGMSDLKNSVLRMIGDPAQRYREDPVRILRAIRLAVKLNFTIEANTERPILEHIELLNNVPAARLFEEFAKMFLGGHSAKTFTTLEKYQVLPLILPFTATALRAANANNFRLFLEAALQNSDQRVREDKPITPAFILSVLLWPAYQQAFAEQIAIKQPVIAAGVIASEKVLREQQQYISVPRRFQFMIRDIWELQNRLVQLNRRQAIHCLHHARFRAAYDFLILRARFEPELLNVATFWTEIQEIPEEQRRDRVLALPGRKTKGPRKTKTRSSKTKSKGES